MTEQTKLDRLDEYLATNELESVWFATPPMFAWLTGGSNLIAREGAADVAAGYDGEEITVVTANIEGKRLLDEEIDADIRLLEYPWYESGVEEAFTEVASKPAAADFACGDFDRIEQAELATQLHQALQRRGSESLPWSSSAARTAPSATGTSPRLTRTWTATRS